MGYRSLLKSQDVAGMENLASAPFDSAVVYGVL